jgi:hypothetical protein
MYMHSHTTTATNDYRFAMGRLLMLYTQVDRLIMEICAERLDEAPDERAQLALGKQVGDESRHVSIQQEWMHRFGVDATPVITPAQERTIRNHFRALPWLDFLADMYLTVEALGSEAVEQVVPLADPGTRESLRVPLTDEIDHVAFGIGRLKEELARLPKKNRQAFVEGLPARIDMLTDAFDGFGVPVRSMFEAVGADYEVLRQTLYQRRDQLLADLTSATFRPTSCPDSGRGDMT